MKKTIIGIVIGIIVLGGLIWLARPTTQSGQPASLVSPPAGGASGVLSTEKSSFDFGTISMAAGKISHSFKIKNTGQESVMIEKMYTSCMCTTAMLKINNRTFGPYGMPGHGFIPSIKEKIAPNEEAVIDVIFDPSAHGPAGVGRIQRVIVIENSAGEPLQLNFTANVTP